MKVNMYMYVIMPIKPTPMQNNTGIHGGLKTYFAHVTAAHGSRYTWWDSLWINATKERRNQYTPLQLPHLSTFNCHSRQ